MANSDYPLFQVLSEEAKRLRTGVVFLIGEMAVLIGDKRHKIHVWWSGGAVKNMSLSSCSRNHGSRASMDIPSMASRRDVGGKHGGNGKTDVTNIRVSTTEENATAQGRESPMGRQSKDRIKAD